VQTTRGVFDHEIELCEGLDLPGKNPLGALEGAQPFKTVVVSPQDDLRPK